MRFLMLFTVLFFLLFSAFAWAQNQDQGVAVELTEEEPEELDVLPESAFLLGKKEENGIIAMAWVYRAPASSVETISQPELPYLLFLRFLSVENNIAVEKGLVAYKLENMEGIATPAVKMEFKNGYFVDDLSSIYPGHYTLNIGCKLEDDKKRQFQYDLVIK